MILGNSISNIDSVIITNNLATANTEESFLTPEQLINSNPILICNSNAKLFNTPAEESPLAHPIPLSGVHPMATSMQKFRNRFSDVGGVSKFFEILIYMFLINLLKMYNEPLNESSHA